MTNCNAWNYNWWVSTDSTSESNLINQVVYQTNSRVISVLDVPIVSEYFPVSIILNNNPLTFCLFGYGLLRNNQISFDCMLLKNKIYFLKFNYLNPVSLKIVYPDYICNYKIKIENKNLVIVGEDCAK